MGECGIRDEPALVAVSPLGPPLSSPQGGGREGGGDELTGQRDELRIRLLRWHQRQRREPEDLDDWEPPRDLERAWVAWTLLESTGWRYLLTPGGLLDQPDALMSDVAIIAWLSSIVEKHVTTLGKKNAGRS